MWFWICLAKHKNRVFQIFRSRQNSSWFRKMPDFVAILSHHHHGILGTKTWKFSRTLLQLYEDFWVQGWDILEHVSTPFQDDFDLQIHQIYHLHCTRTTRWQKSPPGRNFNSPSWGNVTAIFPVGFQLYLGKARRLNPWGLEWDNQAGKGSGSGYSESFSGWICISCGRRYRVTDAKGRDNSISSINST